MDEAMAGVPVVDDPPRSVRERMTDADRRRTSLPAVVFAGAMALLVVALGLNLLLSGPGAATLIASSWSSFLGRLDGLTVDVPMLVASAGDPGNEPGSVVCKDVARREAARIHAGFRLVRQTGEGARLFRQLIDEGVCVTVRELQSQSGVAYSIGDDARGWEHSYVAIDRDLLAKFSTEILAATLIHEAAHIDRSVHGVNCELDDSCTILKNGVRLEEEIAAHAVEARWWIATFGPLGKPPTSGADLAQNELALAYQSGSKVFAQYVRELRSAADEGHWTGDVGRGTREGG